MSPGIVTLAFCLGFAHAAGATVQASGDGDCAVTRSTESYYGNDFLQEWLRPDGKFVFAPGGAGFVDRDGALGIKFAWNRLIEGDLYVGGRRLDGEAPPARAYMSSGYGDSGFQPTYLVFPMAGCWEITGGVGDARLKFVVYVEKVGDGPSWRFEGLGPGWRQTTGPENVSAETSVQMPSN